MKIGIVLCIIFGFVNCDNIFEGEGEDVSPSVPLSSVNHPMTPLPTSQSPLKVASGTAQENNNTPQQRPKFILQTQPPIFLARAAPSQISPLSPGDVEIEQLQLQAESSNDLAHRLHKECPQVTCSGLDCAFVVVNGCRTCVCPIGSPARGCDRLPDNFWRELMNGGCPGENPNDKLTAARRVIRWYRFTDEDQGISECRYYMFPYCNDSDFNFWRSPRTKAECQFYCFRQGGEIDPVKEVPL